MGRKVLPVPDDIAAIIRAEYPDGDTRKLAARLGRSEAWVRVAAGKLGVAKSANYMQIVNARRASAARIGKLRREQKGEQRISQPESGVTVHRIL